ncbi:unnamed protein product [Arctogadus glacialis]
MQNKSASFRPVSPAPARSWFVIKTAAAGWWGAGARGFWRGGEACRGSTVLLAGLCAACSCLLIRAFHDPMCGNIAPSSGLERQTQPVEEEERPRLAPEGGGTPPDGCVPRQVRRLPAPGEDIIFGDVWSILPPPLPLPPPPPPPPAPARTAASDRLSHRIPGPPEAPRAFMAPAAPGTIAHGAAAPRRFCDGRD